PRDPGTRQLSGSRSARHRILIVATLHSQPILRRSRRYARFSWLSFIRSCAIPMAPPARLWDFPGCSNRAGRGLRRDLTMDVDAKDILDFLQTTARSLGAEVTSPWFYFQIGLILTGTGIAYAAGAAIRSRVDLKTLGATWPAAFRMIARVLVTHASTAVFALLMRITRLIMQEVTWPSRSYLLAVFAKLALAW